MLILRPTSLKISTEYRPQCPEHHFSSKRRKKYYWRSILILRPTSLISTEYRPQCSEHHFSSKRRNPPQDQAWISLLNASSRYQKFYCGLCLASQWPPDWPEQIQWVSKIHFLQVKNEIENFVYHLFKNKNSIVASAFR